MIGKELGCYAIDKSLTHFTNIVNFQPRTDK